MASCLALRVALLLISGVLAPAVLTGKRCGPLALLLPTSQGQQLPLEPDMSVPIGHKPLTQGGMPSCGDSGRLPQCWAVETE